MSATSAFALAAAVALPLACLSGTFAIAAVVLLVCTFVSASRTPDTEQYTDAQSRADRGADARTDEYL